VNENFSLKEGSATHPHQTSYFSAGQFEAEIRRCEDCQEKPCQQACPCDCSPADFIKAVKIGHPSDYARAAAQILAKNPLGGICGLVCPDKHCMAACSHKKFDSAINIPKLQATIIERAKQLGVMPRFERQASLGQKVAVIGAGPAGLGAAYLLSRYGYQVTVYERRAKVAGMCQCIPSFRLDPAALKSDIDWLLSVDGIQLMLNQRVEKVEELLAQGYAAVLVTSGLEKPIQLGIPGEEFAVYGLDFLEADDDASIAGKNVAVVGGGATAFDCAMTALARGAAHVEMIALERLNEMPLSQSEFDSLLASNIDLVGRTRVTQILSDNGKIIGIETIKVRLQPGASSFQLNQIEPVAATETRRKDIQSVIIAIGHRAVRPSTDNSRIFLAGDLIEGPTTVVEAVAAGKNIAEQIHATIQKKAESASAKSTTARKGPVKSRVAIPGYNFCPVSLQTDFFGRPIKSPFLLSAAPPSDGLEQMKKAYEAGWAGGIMKTAFDNVPIHIPAEYMFAFNGQTYANCDNVSGHALERVCREVEILVKDYPDRLTMASTGGPVSGNDAEDMRQWQSNTRKLEQAGVMGIEYSLSCPQGGDGTEGDIVSQNAALTAKIIEWVLQGGSPQVPKLFKLTGAVTSIAVIIAAIKEVFSRYPDHKAGITLANTFPTLAFRAGEKSSWEEGVIVGMSGEGVLNISYLTLAKAAPFGVAISGNGGPMDYMGAAHFLALGAQTVQFCTIVMKHGYGIIEDLESGLSHLMAHRGLRSMKELIGRAQPEPVTDFMALTPRKKISQANQELCMQCGNCARCSYLAIARGPEGYPLTDPARCIGCSICARKCFAQAIVMRERTAHELEALVEA
jgi:NADPH-dependent glutamate synthase beta subunit-like oxidoreductase/dihydroorotate dehydrogenase